MNASVEMPRYRCHKEVRALEILCFDQLVEGKLYRLQFKEAGYEPITVQHTMFARYWPVEGDFYVVYSDGYASISPRKAFLDGYTPASPSPGWETKPS